MRWGSLAPSGSHLSGQELNLLLVLTGAASLSSSKACRPPAATLAPTSPEEVVSQPAVPVGGSQQHGVKKVWGKEVMED